MDEITNALFTLGLSDKEARVYVALLGLGRGSAYGVAEKSGLKKPTAYVVIGELIKKGFVFKIPRVKKQLFIAKPPHEVFAIAEERMRQAKKVLPELERVADESKVEVKTLYFEGLKGMEEAIRYRAKELRGKEVVGFYAKPDEGTPAELLSFFRRLNKKVMMEGGIKVRGLAPDDEVLTE